MKKIKVLAVLLTVFVIFAAFPLCASAQVELYAPSVILIEANTGKILYEENADETRHPASVTKIMTLLLVFEAIEKGKIQMSDIVTVSDNAAKMGGSQIFLEVGEKMSVEDLVKSVVVCSANDAALALAEFVSGSESAFVEEMNNRAKELGMSNTRFENTNGLDDTTDTHLTTARDISLMSRELIVNHPDVLKYTTIWQDTIRNGEFTLTNTNKLIRFYDGANGLKTGFTSKSGYCISAAAKRDGMQLIAVIMGAETSDKRNVTAKRLFDYGFANYAYVEFEAPEGLEYKVVGGVKNSSFGGVNSTGTVVEKALSKDVKAETELYEKVAAPVKKGDVVGKVVYKSGDIVLGEETVYAAEDVEKMTYFELFSRIISKYFML